MKLIAEQVQLHTDTHGEPRQMHWRKRRYQFVQVLEQWQYNGDWWLTPDLSGAQRRYCRVKAICVESQVPGDETLSMEIYEEGAQWTLSRLLD